MLLEQRHQFCHVFALTTRLQVTNFFGHFLDDRFFLILTLFRPGFGGAGGGSADFEGDLLTVSFGAVFLDGLSGNGALGLGPFGATFVGGVTLSNLLAFNFLHGLTVGDIIFNLVLVVSGSALGLVIRDALDR
jgi:hypothetical protein